MDVVVPELTERPANVPPERVVDFDVYHPLRAGLDFHRSWKDLQDTTPFDVIWSPRNGGHWMVLRGALIDRVLKDYEHFTSYTVLIPKATAGQAYRLIPLSVDPPQHGPFRKLMDDNLNPKAVRDYEPHVRKLTVDLIEGFRQRGRCNFTHDFAEQLPIRIFMRIVDLPMQDLPTLKYLADQFTRPDGTLPYSEVRRRFADYLRPVIEARRGGSGTDMISNMVNGQVFGRPLTEPEAVDLCTQTLVGGLDTVVNFMGFVMSYLAVDDERRRELVADPKRIPRAIVEFVRRFGVTTESREVVNDVEFEGLQLLKGDMIVAPAQLHGLDDRVNPDPLAVRFDRGVVGHSGFGSGPHRCPGSHLATAELRILLEEWLARIPEFSIAPDCKVEYRGGIVGSVLPFSLAWDVATTRTPA